MTLARPVRPLCCPKCDALWLFWPAEQGDVGCDTLNLRSLSCCSYCEAAKPEDLVPPGKLPGRTRPDPGWVCSRAFGHSGPCAAWPVSFATQPRPSTGLPVAVSLLWLSIAIVIIWAAFR